MTSEETLKLLGTITLSKDFMLDTIQFGELFTDENGRTTIQVERNPNMLNLGLWLLMIPGPFKEAAEIHMRAITPKYLNTPCTAKMIYNLVMEFQNKVYEDYYQTRKLSRHGWEF